MYLLVDNDLFSLSSMTGNLVMGSHGTVFDLHEAFNDAFGDRCYRLYLKNRYIKTMLKGKALNVVDNYIIKQLMEDQIEKL
jgi:hypothetical protein